MVETVNKVLELGMGRLLHTITRFPPVTNMIRLKGITETL